MSPVRDPAAYGPDWRQVSDAIRFGRARGRCECRGECGTRGARKACADPDLEGRCRAEHGKPNPRTTSMVILTVAHLDDNPGTNDPDRLRAFCQGCHLAYDIRVHRANRIASAAGDTLDLFRVGGLYE